MGHKEAVLALGDGQSEIALAVIRMIKGPEQTPPQ
jgi:hypothetical protein